MAKSNPNYDNRPSKNINRKIIIEILREIFGAYGCKNHTYIGFGALFFSDFKLMHKHLGINSMISIEGLDSNKSRYLFNRPFSSIKLEVGMSNDVLPTIDWKGKKILWLDYTDSLSPSILEDIETIFSNLVDESFFMLTCNATIPERYRKDLDTFFDTFPTASPSIVLEALESSKNTPQIFTEILKNKIDGIINDRNSGKPNNERLIFHQLISIRYKDSAPMYTFGGILLKKRNSEYLNKIKTMKMPYLKSHLNIEAPLITNKEINLMNSLLPKRKGAFLNSKKLSFIPDECKEAYFDFYKFHPSYFEIIE